MIPSYPDQDRPYRSVLYIPGANRRALEKAATLECDAIIFDLEDAVAPDEKPAARALVAEVLATTDFGRRARIVRINGLDSDWGRQDCAGLAGVPMDGLLIPKVSSAADVQAVAALVPDMPLWAMMETALVAWSAPDIAAHPRMAGLVIGTNDLAKEIGARFRPDRLPLVTALSLCLMAGKAHGRIVVDGVYNAFRDQDGLRAECEQGRDMGFDGKTLIHPAQIAIANQVFAPSEADIDLARRQIAAHARAAQAGSGVAVVDGRIVENLHVATAERVLARAAAIAVG